MVHELFHKKISLLKMVSEEVESSQELYVAFMIILRGFSGGASGKESSCHAGDKRDDDVIPTWGRSPGV